MKDYSTYIFDIDGTLVKQNKVLEGAIDYLKHLREGKKQILFATNTPLYTQAMLTKKLNRLGVYVEEKEIITPIDAANIYFKQEKKPITVLGIIHPKVVTKLIDLGWDITHSKDFNKTRNYTHVLLGMYTKLTYLELVAGLQSLDRGAKLLVMNPDLFCPIKTGRIIDSGSLGGIYEKCTGEEATVIGKPTYWMQKAIEDKLRYPLSQCLFIGDSPFTDMRMGREMGMDTLFLKSGINEFLSPSIQIDATYSFPTIKYIPYANNSR
ncbi:putative sugar phosphatases of the HAD superfamily [Clostridium aceticum]|uniref:Putative sugar phosphatases of the HAD superfamily n=1 Tax=Clostridium aceticum TaxID=84022 RepID=A0A0D8IAS4_9CLOT|nr:HAD-IIA family hydrolase [Clostridium aceticum]AKL95907.1 putative sugar phosphatases of the HAD superfamily [Clostridium aceticum]KJF27137.1 hypothetical protein TZ02_10115 [Clostridium aceticum]